MEWRIERESRSANRNDNSRERMFGGLRRDTVDYLCQIDDNARVVRQCWSRYSKFPRISDKCSIRG